MTEGRLTVVATEGKEILDSFIGFAIQNKRLGEARPQKIHSNRNNAIKLESSAGAYLRHSVAQGITRRGLPHRYIPDFFAAGFARGALDFEDHGVIGTGAVLVDGIAFGGSGAVTESPFPGRGLAGGFVAERHKPAVHIHDLEGPVGVKADEAGFERH